MTYFEIMDLFTLYGVDVAALGIVTSALTQILKKTLLKKAPAKIYTFLPFALGLALYFMYAAATGPKAFCSPENIGRMFERGLSVGAAATMVYVIYEQFLRGKKGENADSLAVACILEGYFSGDKLSTVAQSIANECAGTETDVAEKIEKLLLCESEEEMNAAEAKAISRLIARLLEKNRNADAE